MARKGWASELALSVFGLELRHCVFDDDRQLAGKKLNEFSCADFEFDPGSLPRIEQEVIPEGRRDDLIYSDVPNVTQPLGFNPLERVRRSSVRSRPRGYSMSSRRSGPTPGARAWSTFCATPLALRDQPEATLADLLRLLDDAPYRRKVRVATQRSRRGSCCLRDPPGAEEEACVHESQSSRRGNSPLCKGQHKNRTGLIQAGLGKGN